ncbi:unnamed protein product [Linum trigynum]|uniref:Uncharacterized protein n=1 Tax=Linum trigynum TaxID=586398 RepID=A0AAV2D0R2_9ROSI
METKQTEDENEVTQKEMGFQHGECWSTDTSGGGRAGGLCIWWVEEVNLTVMSSSLHHLDTKIEEVKEVTWIFTGIYGWPEREDKFQTWDLICRLAGQWTGPWLSGGWGTLTKFCRPVSRVGDELL